MRPGLITALGVTLFLWASAFAGIRAALQGYSPFHLAVGRFIIASAILTVLACVKRIPLPERCDLPRVALTGFFGVTAYHIALNLGEVTVTAGAASFIVNTAPIFTSLLAGFFLQERIHRSGWIGMMVSFVGVGLIAAGEDSQLQFNAGTFAILLAALFQSLYFVLQKPLLNKYGVFAVVVYGFWAGTIGLLVFLPGFARQVAVAPVASTFALLYLAVFPSIIAYLSWSYVLSKIAASRAAAFLYLVPGITILIALVWLGEFPSRLSL
jgi:drug/metabolite transporter (DMT)-like permease